MVGATIPLFLKGSICIDFQVPGFRRHSKANAKDGPENEIEGAKIK